MPINVLNYNPIKNLAGASQSAMVLAEGLKRFSVISYAMVLEEGPLAEEYRKVFKDVEALYPSGDSSRIGSAKRFIFLSIRLWKLLREWDIDLVHCHSASGVRSLFPVCRLLGIPLICHVRDNYENNRFNRGLGLSDRLIAISNWVYAGLPFRLQAKAIVIPNAVVALGEPKPFNFSDGRPLQIGFAGRWVRDKGIDTLLTALGKMENVDNVNVVIMGKSDGEPNTYTAEVISQHGSMREELRSRVSLRHFSKNTEEFYQETDVVVIPSRFAEPFGRVAIEAMSHGCIAVAAGHGGLLEIITDGVDGYLLKPNDAAALAEKLDQIVSNRKGLKEVSDLARARVESKFLAEMHAKHVLEVYKDVLTY